LKETSHALRPRVQSNVEEPVREAGIRATPDELTLNVAERRSPEIKPTYISPRDRTLPAKAPRTTACTVEYRTLALTWLNSSALIQLRTWLARLAAGYTARLPRCEQQCRAGARFDARKPPHVVDVVDEPRKIRGDILESVVVHQVPRLDLEGLDETFGFCVVVGAPPSHRAKQAMLGEQSAVDLGGVLRSSIGMMHAARRRSTNTEGGLESRQR
jgi:hypothetical protein